MKQEKLIAIGKLSVLKFELEARQDKLKDDENYKDLILEINKRIEELILSL